MNYESMTQEQKRAYGFIKLTKDQLHVMKNRSEAETKQVHKPEAVPSKDHLRLIVNN